MKKLIFWFLILHIFIVNAQKNGSFKTIIYNIGNYTITTENKKNSTAEKIKLNQDKIQFELKIDSISSVFNQIEKMEEKNNMDYKIASVINGGSLIYYKNIITNQKFYQADLQGQLFNIQLPFEQYKWQISTETKIISGFKCYKATTTFEKTNKIRGITKVFTPAVWFSPDIPSSFGPLGLDGLPGLVLEATIDGNKFYYATKIILNETKNTVVEKPTNGKNVSEKEFEDINANIYNEIQSNK